MTEIEKFKKVTALNYKDQAIFFLNAFWVEVNGDTESVWQYYQKIVSLDNQKGKEGSDLDEFCAHRFLEQFGETKRVVELRDALREIDKDSNKRMALVEYLLYRYKQSIKELLARPQGTNEELIKAQEALNNVSREIEKIEKKKSDLQAKSQESGVKGKQAKAELDQLLTADNTDLNRAMLTAEAAVRKAQKLGGTAAQGSLWWVDRELTELKKYKPKSKQ